MTAGHCGKLCRKGEARGEVTLLLLLLLLLLGGGEEGLKEEVAPKGQKRCWWASTVRPAQATAVRALAVVHMGRVLPKFCALASWAMAASTCSRPRLCSVTRCRRGKAGGGREDLGGTRARV